MNDILNTLLPVGLLAILGLICWFVIRWYQRRKLTEFRMNLIGVKDR